MVDVTLFEGSKACFSSPSEVVPTALFYDFSCLKVWERMVLHAGDCATHAGEDALVP